MKAGGARQGEMRRQLVKGHTRSLHGELLLLNKVQSGMGEAAVGDVSGSGRGFWTF